MGEDHPIVITSDIAIYENVVQLLYARPDLKRTVVLGELHVTMAALRALGDSWRTLVHMMPGLKPTYSNPPQYGRF